MCGIVGYVGSQDATAVIIEGLRRLEYRGYDSAGIAVVTPEGVEARKRAGKLANLEAALAEMPMKQATVGIGHTRWATHGAPNDVNAHPHQSEDGRLAVIHNGIIENFAELRAELTEQGFTFLSDTDTEVAAHLLSVNLRTSVDLTEAMQRTCRQLRGAFTLVAASADDPDTLVGARRNSPLVVGLGDGETFLASDVSAFIAHTRSAMELGQDQVITITREGVSVTGFDGAPGAGSPYEVTWDASAAEKGGYDLFMLKEIAEQPKAVADTLLGRVTEDNRLVLDGLEISDHELREVDKIVVAACGTAYHAGLVAKYAIEHWTRIPVEVELASEFRYRDPILNRRTLVIAISQSGETMDTLMAVRHAREQGSRVLSICNTQGATIPRESDGALYTYAGPEIAVASTKAFLTQLVATHLFGMYLAQVRGNFFGDEIRGLVSDLASMPNKIDLVLDTMDPTRGPRRAPAPRGSRTPARCSSSVATLATPSPSRGR
jgi:glucosamine--fructose-6-phosphate aminotransferase (isomerizing)